MRRLALVVALAACSRGDDVRTLHDEAVAIASYYRPVADELERRLTSITTRGPRLGESLPGAQEANAHRERALRATGAFRDMVGSRTTAGALVHRADELAQARDTAKLAELVDVARAKLAEDSAAINDQIGFTEAWLVRAEAQVRPTR